MALIKCQECGKEISEKADSCPNCGFKIKKTEQNSSSQLKVGTVISIIACAIILILICYIFAINIKTPSGYESNSSDIVINTGAESIDTYTSVCLLISLSIAPICLVLCIIFLLKKFNNIILYKICMLLLALIQTICAFISFAAIGCCGIVYLLFPILNFIGAIIIVTGKK